MLWKTKRYEFESNIKFPVPHLEMSKAFVFSFKDYDKEWSLKDKQGKKIMILDG